MSRMIRFTRISTWLFFFGLSVGAMLLSSFYLYLRPGLPSVDQLVDIRLQTPLRVYSSDKRLIAEFGEKRRAPITIEQIPNLQLHAFLAAEDSRFYEHNGVDIKGLVRAAVELVTTGSIRSGGSTITMQVAKNYFLTRERTFIRKFNEILLAFQIERELPKNRILELYLNKIYLGNRAYGIQAASQVYYGKPVNELELAQMAMLAGLPKAPSAYNPLADPQRALSRRNWILQRMRELGYISDTAYDLASRAPITATYHGAEYELDAAYVAEMARAEMVRRYGDDAYTDGYKVYLTVDSEKQKAANDALQAGLEAYDHRHGFRGPLGHLDEETLKAGELDKALGSYPAYPGLIPVVVTNLSDDSATVYSQPTGETTMPLDTMKWAREYRNENRRGSEPTKPADVLKVGDVVYARPQSPPPSSSASDDELPETVAKPSMALEQLPQVEGALISLDAKTGGIQALTGGYSFEESKYNRAIQAKRQPGSNFKPFLYLSALEKGKTAATVINDAPIVLDDADQESVWRPENSGSRFAGPTRLRKALYQSRNLVSIRLLRSIGIDYTLDYLQQLKIDTSGMPHNLTLALGSGTLSPMEVARGFAVIANGGYDVTPYLIDRIEDSRGNILYAAPSVIQCDDDCADLATRSPTPDAGFPAIRTAPRLADKRAVYIMHSILRDVIEKGTGRRALALNRKDVAGKTGTTNEQRDAWFSGFNHDLATTAWVGFDTPRPMGRGEYGAVAALPVWLDYMKVALKDAPSSYMPRPNGIVTVKIDPETGERAAPGNPDAIFELFREENVPAQQSADTIRNQDSGDAVMPQELF
ncbi:penicillin-binding protein 1A [Marinobacter sp. R17]|uniref:penicillin-binding protein 1A n=1 Tax=Marinobacter sp. R17 TaxID=2484250 RepID=UPI000F4C38DE|nr:penicillin-binding protein 1A [Marinobacter sp. R17]